MGWFCCLVIQKYPERRLRALCLFRCNDGGIGVDVVVDFDVGVVITNVAIILDRGRVRICQGSFILSHDFRSAILKRRNTDWIVGIVDEHVAFGGEMHYTKRKMISSILYNIV